MFPKNARSGASLAAVAVLCCVGCAAFAARAGEINELHTALTVEQDYDSNIFFTDKDPTGSGITIIRPALSYENHGTLGLHPAVRVPLRAPLLVGEQALGHRPRHRRRHLAQDLPAHHDLRERELPAPRRAPRDPRLGHRDDAGERPGAGRGGRPAGTAGRGRDPGHRPRPGHFWRPPGAHAAARARGLRRPLVGRLPRRQQRPQHAARSQRLVRRAPPSPTCSRRSTGRHSACRATTPTSPTRSATRSW